MNRRSACRWCGARPQLTFYYGKRALRCKCHYDRRTPLEKRRDAVLDKYGDDPASYTPKVLAKLAQDGLFDLSAAFCPAGKLTAAEAKAREASQVSQS